MFNEEQRDLKGELLKKLIVFHPLVYAKLVSISLFLTITSFLLPPSGKYEMLFHAKSSL